jgi:hypothetical protein
MLRVKIKSRATDEHGLTRKEEAMSHLEDALLLGKEARQTPKDGKSGRAKEELYLWDGSFHEKDATSGLVDA